MLDRVQHAVEERTGTLVLCLCEYLLWITFLYDAPLIQKNDAIGHRAGETHLVSNHHHGSSFLRKLTHDTQYFADKLGIERGGRLIEK